MRVRFATVGFQTETFVLTRSPVYSSCLKMTLLEEVMVEMELWRNMMSKRIIEDLLHENIGDDVHSEETPEKGDHIEDS